MRMKKKFLCFWKNINIKKINMMKTIFFFFAMAVCVAAIATQPEPPVYYTGNNEPAASGVYFITAADTLQPTLIAPDTKERAEGKDAPACPVYYTGNDEPAAFGLYIME
jgi:hypothetical protein